MSDNQFHKQFSEGDELPVNIPPTDYAWSDMRNKLDADMPEEPGAAGNGAAGKSFRNLWKWFTGLVLLSFISWVVLTQLPAKKENGITSSAKASKENNSSNNNSGNNEKNNSDSDSNSNNNNSKDNKDSNTASSNNTVADTKEDDKQNQSANTTAKQNAANEVNNAYEQAALNNNSDTKTNKKNNTTNKAIDDTQSTTTNETTKRNNPAVKENKAITGKGNKKDIVVATGNVTKKKNNGGKLAGNNNEANSFSTDEKLNTSLKRGNGKPSPSKQITGKKSNAVDKNEKAAIDLRNTFVTADNSDAAIVNRKLPSALPEDPTAGSSLREKSPASPAKAHIKLQGGLQWNFQSPSGGNGSYFYNEKGKPEPLRAFYPGAWLSFQQNKSLYTIEVSPFFTTTLPAKSYSSETLRYTIGDTSFTSTETKTLRKLFGISAAIGYSHNITGNWWAGGSLRSNWWQKGAASSTIDLLKRSDSGTFADIKSASSRTFLLNDTTWSTFSKMQFVMNADIFYRRNVWQAGLQVGLPINSLTRRNGPRNPLYAAIVLRLAIPPRSGKR